MDGCVERFTRSTPFECSIPLHHFNVPSLYTISTFSLTHFPQLDMVMMMVTNSYAVPSLASIRALVELCPVVELGAGTGYWASLVRAAGDNPSTQYPTPSTQFQTPLHNFKPLYTISKPLYTSPNSSTQVPTALHNHAHPAFGLCTRFMPPYALLTHRYDIS